MMLVDPDDPGAKRDVGIAQNGWRLVTVSPCCHAKLGWVFTVGGRSPEGFWNCSQCKVPLLRMKNYRDDGFGENATSEIEVFSRAGWVESTRIRGWVAAWLRCLEEDVSLTLELVED
jgi:hypothetical protein